MRFRKISTILFLLSWSSAAPSIDPQSPLFPSSTSTSSLLLLHKALISHESITGNEQSVTKWLVSYLKHQNFTVETQEVTPSTNSQNARHNIFAYVGKQRETRTLITSHIDVVPPFWPYDRRGEEIWGRGSVDAKASVATQINAVEELLAAGKIGEGDIALLFVVGEETNGDGMLKAK
jgi:acetylornithine deacetylase